MSRNRIVFLVYCGSENSDSYANEEVDSLWVDKVDAEIRANELWLGRVEEIELKE